jgi:hypothetical protein
MMVQQHAPRSTESSLLEMSMISTGTCSQQVAVCGVGLASRVLCPPQPVRCSWWHAADWLGCRAATALSPQHQHQHQHQHQQRC